MTGFSAVATSKMLPPAIVHLDLLQALDCDFRRVEPESSTNHDSQGDVLTGIVKAGGQASQPEVIHEQRQKGSKCDKCSDFEALKTKCQPGLPGGLLTRMRANVEDRARS